MGMSHLINAAFLSKKGQNEKKTKICMEDWRLKVMINAFYAVRLSKKGGKEKNKVMYGGKEVEALKVINKSFFVTKEEGNNPWPLVVHQNIFFLLERSM
jgi:hypothetical protein